MGDSFTLQFKTTILQDKASTCILCQVVRRRQLALLPGCCMSVGRRRLQWPRMGSTCWTRRLTKWPGTLKVKLPMTGRDEIVQVMRIATQWACLARTSLDGARVDIMERTVYSIAMP